MSRPVNSQIKRSANAIPRWPFTINRQSDQARDLIAWWPGEWGGVSVVDRAGNFNGTRQAPLSLACDVSGLPSVTSENYVLLPTDVNVSGSITISVWATFGAISAYRTFVAKRDVGTSATNYALRLGGALTNDNKLCFYWYNGGFQVFQSTAILGATGSLIHYAVSYQPGSDPVLWANGDTYAGTFALGSSVALVTNNAQASIGALNNGTEAMVGQLRDVRIYNRALSIPELRALYDPATRYELYQRPRRVFGKASVGDTARPRYGDHHHVLAM